MEDITLNIANKTAAPAIGQVRKEEPVKAETARTEKRVRITQNTKAATASVESNSNVKGALLDVDADTSLEKAAASIETLLPDSFTNNTRLSINRDDDTGRFVYRTVDKRSGEVVRQFPPEDILKYIVSVRKAEGLVVDGKV